MKVTWKDRGQLPTLNTWTLVRNSRTQKKEYKRNDHTGNFAFDLEDDVMHGLSTVVEPVRVNGSLFSDGKHHPAVTFVYNKLVKNDCRKLEEFKVTALPKRTWSYTITNPQRIGKGRRYWKHFYAARMGVNPNTLFPHAEKIAIGSYKMGGDWGYEEQLVEFKSLDELFVFVAGALTYRFLKHDKQIEEGRLGNPSSNQYGLEWLKEFSGSDPMVVRGKHFHSIDDEFWVQKK